MGEWQKYPSSKKKLNHGESYKVLLTVYQKMLFGMGVLPSELDEEDAEVFFQVVGVGERKLEFIDLV